MENWPETAKKAANAMIEKYGEPHEQAANILALNLAHDIIENKKTVEEARQFYADTMMKMMQGEESEYLKKLTFNISERDVNNPDETIMDMSKVKEMKKKME